MADLVAILKALPALLALIRQVKKAVEEGKTQMTVNQHLAGITDAYKAKDASKLDALFNTPTS